MHLEMLIKIFKEDKEAICTPVYSSEGAAGVDFYAWKFAGDREVCDEVFLDPGEKVLVRTGIHMAIPDGYYLSIVPRSGMACKQDLTVANAPGTIDQDYRGEIMICLRNTGIERRSVKLGDRVAQGIFSTYVKARFLEKETLEDLGETVRGSGGFGSTGKS